MACINSPEADELVEKGRQELDPDARMEIYKQLSELNNENAWYIPILTSTNTLCARNYVNNAYGDSAAYYYIADWSFNRE